MKRRKLAYLKDFTDETLRQKPISRPIFLNFVERNDKKDKIELTVKGIFLS